MIAESIGLRLITVLFALILCSCQPSSPAPAQASQVAQSFPQVIIQSDTPGKEEVQTIEIDNCNGKSDLMRTEQRTQSIDVSVSAEIAAKIGASIEVISAEVQGTVGASRTNGASRTTGINLTAPPKSRMVFQLSWIGNEQIGIVQNVRNSNIPVAFRGFVPTDVKIKSQQDLGCPGVNAPQPVLPIPPTYTPLPTLTPYPTVPPPTIRPTVVPTSQATVCFPQTGWTPPTRLPNGEWLYDCLSAGSDNWIGQDEPWKATNWKRGTGQSEIINIVVPSGAIKMGIGCDPCTILKPDGNTISSPNGDIGPFKPNISVNVKPGETYKAKIFGGDSCPTRKTTPPCSPEIYIYFNLP